MVLAAMIQEMTINMTSDGTRTISRLPVILVDMDFFLSLFKIFDILYPRCHGIGLSRQTAAQFHSNFLSYIKNIIPYAGEKEKKIIPLLSAEQGGPHGLPVCGG